MGMIIQNGIVYSGGGSSSADVDKQYVDEQVRDLKKLIADKETSSLVFSTEDDIKKLFE